MYTIYDYAYNGLLYLNNIMRPRHKRLSQLMIYSTTACQSRCKHCNIWQKKVEHSTKLQTFEPQRGLKYAVVLGNEVKGVHQKVVDASDGCLEIPQLGTKHSMNVSVTAGIIIYKFAEELMLQK